MPAAGRGGGDERARELRARLSDPIAVCSALGLDEGAQREGGGLKIRCPWHSEARPSCSVKAYQDGAIGVKCFSCQKGGDVFSLIAVAKNLDPARDFPRILEEAERLAGEAPRGPARPARGPAPPPALEELRQLWAECLPATAEAAELERRGLDPGALADREILRCLPRIGSLPPWARRAGASWQSSGHRAIFALYNHRGELASVHARNLAPAAPDPKALHPIGGSGRGLILADLGGQVLLTDGRIPEGGWILIGEGCPDFATLASVYSDADEGAPAAVLAVIEGSWTEEIAARIPDRARVVIWTHADAQKIDEATGKRSGQAGQKYARRIAASLASRCDLYVVQSICPPGAKKAPDANDLLQQGGAELVRQQITAAEPAPAAWRGLSAERAAAERVQLLRERQEDDGGGGRRRQDAQGRPLIVIGVREHEVNDQAIEALAELPGLYQRGGALVRVVRDPGAGRAGVQRETGAPRINQLPASSLRELLTKAATWVRWKKGPPLTPEDEELAWLQAELEPEKVFAPAHPPDWATRAAHARGEWPAIPLLESVVEAPVLRADGTILQEPGYDPASALLYVPNANYPHIPERPTADDCKRALELLGEVVCDYRFAEPAHKAAWIAGVLTPFARAAFDGPAPLFLIDANTRGSGKSKLVDCASLIFTGRTAPRSSQASDEEEEGKRITSIALSADPLWLIDNITRTFGSGKLDTALTGTTWRERLLGANEVPILPLLVVLWATGNNVQFRQGCDTARRTQHIRIDTPEARPEARSGFRHPDLIGWVRSQRPELAAACCTLLRAYFADGARVAPIPTWGSFEGWSNCIRQVLAYHGLPDPYAAHEALAEEADAASQHLEAMLEGWQELCEDRGEEAMTVHEALVALEEDRIASKEGGRPPRFQRLLFALLELAPIRGPGHLPDAARVGYLFRQYRRRVAGGRRLETSAARSKTGTLWRVVRVR